jgi:hypothetical protein
MIDRQAVLEYLANNPNYSTWQMRLHFLQAASRKQQCQAMSIGSIANQLNYILRDLEVSGALPPQLPTAANRSTASNFDSSSK